MESRLRLWHTNIITNTGNPVRMKKLRIYPIRLFYITHIFLCRILFAVFNIFTIRHFNRRIEEIYKNSLNYSSNYWADQFYVANKELTSLINKNNSTDYNLICDSSDSDFIEEKSSDLQRDLTNRLLSMKTRLFFSSLFRTRILCFHHFISGLFQEKENVNWKSIYWRQVNNLLTGRIQAGGKD